MANAEKTRQKLLLEYLLGLRRLSSIGMLYISYSDEGEDELLLTWQRLTGKMTLTSLILEDRDKTRSYF